MRQKERRELLREELNEWGKKHYHANKEIISAKRKIAKKQKKINFIKQTGQLDIFA